MLVFMTYCYYGPSNTRGRDSIPLGDNISRVDLGAETSDVHRHVGRRLVGVLGRDGRYSVLRDPRYSARRVPRYLEGQELGYRRRGRHRRYRGCKPADESDIYSMKEKQQ
jgi:hypothetical protein